MTVKLAVNRRIAGVAAVSALAMTLAACGGNSEGEDTTPAEDTTAEQTEEGGEDESEAGSEGESEEGGEEAPAADLAESLAGGGASSQENAQVYWTGEFMATRGVNTSYDPTGSSAGRENFIAGSIDYAGTDSYFDEEEIAAANERCGSELLELPVYISPTALVYNLPEVENLNLTSEAIAKIFNGDITTWNDPIIAEANEGVELPDTEIIPVHRSDGSGTTKNFMKYLSAVAPDFWPHEAAEDWPVEGGQSGERTSGVIETIKSTEGTIGYADASQAGDLGTAAIQVGESFVEYSPEAAAAIFEGSTPTEDATDLRLTYDLDFATEAEGVYPLVMVSYLAACQTYDDPTVGATVKEFLTYVASEEGQQGAADPEVAGIAPINEELRTAVMAAIDSIG